MLQKDYERFLQKETADVIADTRNQAIRQFLDATLEASLQGISLSELMDLAVEMRKTELEGL